MENIPQSSPQKTQMESQISVWQKVKIGFSAILGVFVIVLIFQNWNTISLNLVFATYDIALPIVIVLSLVTGYLWGTFSSYRKNKKRNKEIKKIIDSDNI